MTQLRERWEGVSLPGDYLLARWLHGDDAVGFFETSPGADGRRAMVKIVRELAVDAEAQLAMWQRTRLLRHPNLCELLDYGRAELPGETAIYAVFERADDTLAGAIAQSPLTEAEACEVLVAVRDGLAYLQAEGLTHPALYPDQVLGVGEAIKLSSDALCQASPGSQYTESLRVFWYKISPCTLTRSTELLAQALGADPSTAGPAEVPLPTAPDAGPAGESTPPEPKRFPKWVLAGAAAVVLVILGLNLRRGHEPPAETVPARTPPPVVTPSADPLKAAPPSAPASTPASVPAKAPSAAKAKPAPRKMWRVIAFTYKTQDAAAKKARQVNERHPDLEASVYSSKEKTGFYLVALGGPTTRDEAVRLQKKARATGLARDVYIHNFPD